MIKAVLILGLVALSTAQVLRISPAVIGSSSAGQLQVIQLSGGGGLGAGGFRAQPARAQLVSAQPARRVNLVAAPQPQLVRVVAQPQPQLARVQLVASQPAARPISFAPSPSYASSRAQSEDNGAPAPYAFAFDSEDEYGTKIGRSEQADGSGKVSGQYTLSDANGISRIVVYIADDNGFRAEVKTNEPGTLTSEPADVKIQSSAAPARR